MAFRRHSQRRARSGAAASLGDICRGGVLLAARLALAVGGIAALAMVVLYLRLLQGPIVLPGMARMLAERVNAASADFRLGVRDAVLTLGEGAEPSGLQFRGVEIRSPDGALLIAAPRVGGHFQLSDLAHGRVQPVRIALIRPDARIVRAEDGRVRVGMGQGAGMPLGRGSVDEAGLVAVARIVDGFVGDLPPIPALARLERIDVLGARLVYDDRRGGRSWATEHADLRLWRHAGGARATLAVAAGRQGDHPGAATLKLSAERPTGRGDTMLRVRFDRLRPEDLAGQAKQLDWLALLDGHLGGEFQLTVGRDGAVGGIRGTLRAQDGDIRGLGAPIPFETAELRFGTDDAGDRLTVNEFKLSAPAVRASFRGHAELRRGPGGEMQGLAGQFELGALNLDLPGVFADPLAFDGGRLTARWSLADQRIEIVDARLGRGDLAFAVEGATRAGAEGWLTDLRVEGAGITARELVAHWPVHAAGNARRWVAGHIPAGRIDRVVAQMRFGGVEPQIALDFAYSDLRAEVVSGMSPIEEAHGSGHVSYHDLHMQMDGGHVAPLGGERVDLAGSTAAIRGFWGDSKPAEISLKGQGASEAVLALIDEDPLRLVQRLGRDLGGIGGTAAVQAELVVPLLKNVKLAQIGVDARAILSDVALPFALSSERSVELRSDRLELLADTDGLRLSGKARAEGAPIAIDWHEAFGPGPDSRTISLSGSVGPALLAAVGAGALPVSGTPGFDLHLDQTGGGPLSFTLDADLAPASVDIAALDWSKPPGAPGRLRAEGTLGDGIDFAALRLEAPGLQARGSAKTDEAGRLLHARFDTLRLAGRGTVAATLRPGPDGVNEIMLTGQELDLSKRFERIGSDPGDPLRVSLDLDLLRLTDRVELSPAEGQLERHPGGWLVGRIEGRLAGEAAVAIDIDLPPDRPGSVVMTSDNAGAALSAIGLYSGAAGGRLTLEAGLGTGEGEPITGRVRIEEVTVRSQSTFRDVLTKGGLDSAGQAVSAGGIGFRKVWIPFSYDDGILTLTDALAVSPALALKLNGTVDERADRVDLLGVLSPAYALTGALNEVPVLGKILGGEGEGVLAMTFRLRGPTGDPRFVVNPLSMLAPGFLRKVFSRPTGDVSDEFLETISRQER